jgi:hypothetical protein
MPYKNNQLALDEVSNTKDCVFNDNNRSLNVTANCNTFSTIEIKNNKFVNSPIPVSDHLKVIDLNNYTEHLELINNHFYGGYSNNTKNTTYISHKILGNNLGTNHLIKSNYFFDSDKGIVTYSDETLAIAENYFNGVKKGLYISGKGQVDNNDFLKLPAAVADNLPFTVDDTYGVFAVGASPKEIILNRFSGASSSNPNQASSYCAVIEASGTAPILFFGNNTEGTDVGIQAEGVNQNLGIFCNNFSLNGIAHNKGALRVTPNTSQFTSFSTPALLRHQGSNCEDTRNPAGNEWFDHTGNKDIVLIPTTYQTSFNFNPSQGNGSTIPYFKYVAHGKDEDLTDRTVPQHNYTAWESLASNELLICDMSTPANVKTSASCIEIGFGTKMLTSRNEAPNGTGTISDLLAIKTNLETDKLTLESQLIDPDNQKDLLNQIQEIDLKIENTIIKLYTLYKEQLNVSMS